MRNLLGKALGVLLALASVSVTANVTLPRYPSISPDGSQIAFSWRGDLWAAPVAGGRARRLTSHPFNDLQSSWSRDGKRIAFVSDRPGSANLFIMNADGTALRQITQTDRAYVLDGFATGENGKEVLTFSARIDPEWYPGGRSYSVSTDGGEPARLFDAFGTTPSVSHDGSRILFTRGGSAWSRRGYRGSDNRNVWLYDRKNRSYKQLTSWEGNDGRAKWIDDGAFIYASDRNDNCVNLYRLSAGADEKTALRLTNFTENDVEDFGVSADGRTLVFAMWDRLYSLDLTKQGAQPRAIDLTADEDEQDNYQIKPVDRSVTEAAISPDGKTMAFVSYGELYVRGVESKSPARRVTATPAREQGIAWAPDGSKLYFTSDSTGREGIYVATAKLTRGEIKQRVEEASQHERPNSTSDEATTEPTTGPSTQTATTRPTEALRWQEAVAFSIQPQIVDEHENRDPRPSPDGKLLSFRRGNGDLMIQDLATGDTRRLVGGWSTRLDWQWSPDSAHIAYVTEDANYNADIWIVSADGRTPAINLTRHPSNDFSPRWSADGKILAFLSARVNRELDVWMVYLDKDLETLTPPELDQYYKDAVAAVKKREPLNAKQSSTQPTTAQTAKKNRKPGAKDKPLDLADAYLRLRRVTSLPGDEGNLELTPAGDKYIFSAVFGPDRALYTVDKDLGAPKKLCSDVSVSGISLTGDQLVFVNDGRGGVIKLPAGEMEYLDISDRIRIDLEKQSEQKFNEASRIVGQQFWDATLNNLDWNKLTQKYLALAKSAHTSDEFDHVAAKFIGELNGSHLGINSPDPTNPNSRPSGRLGIFTKRVGDGYEVVRVLDEGPSGKGPMKLVAGDVITAIDLEPIGAADTLESRLAGRADKETIVTVTRAGRELQLLVTPISYARFSALAYQDWRERMAGQVSEWSGGKIGYIHVRGMDQGSLDVFERDLYAAADGKAGLIVDVRNNGGGWTADRLLASIMAPDHAYTIARGMDPRKDKGYPNDRLFIARYTLPIDMLCNEKSFSNAEIISHAFKTMKRGKLVGQQTAGRVISTGGTVLIDGTTVRIPFRGWFLLDGTCQERNGAVPDILVPQTPEDEAKEFDAQLKAAVDDLLNRPK